MILKKNDESNLFHFHDYKNFVHDIKIRIQKAQIKAALSVNRELLYLYWDLGQSIVEKQKETIWGIILLND